MADYIVIDENTVKIVDEDKSTQVYTKRELVSNIETKKRNRQSLINQRNQRISVISDRFNKQIEPYTADIQELETALSTLDNIED